MILALSIPQSDVTLTDYEDDIVSACEELVADEFTNDFNSQ